MYAVCRQTDPPTAVEHATYCRFLNLQEKALVVAGATYLRVYRLNHNVTSRRPDSSFATGTKLECILSTNLFGRVVSMDSCYLPGARSDCLLLAFDEAKISMVQYDPELHDFKTVSMHSFEEDEFLKTGFTVAFPIPIVRSDPENRCAAMLMYGRHLAVLPFTRDALLDEPEKLTSAAAGGGHAFAHICSYTVTLRHLEERVQNVVDMCFLQGYYEPTLLFLYEPHQTTAGRIAVRSDSYCIIAVSMNVKDKVHAVIWSVNQLPFDSFRIIAVPRPIGGVVVMGANCVVYLNQSVPAYGVMVNSNLKDMTSFPLRNMEDKQIVFDLSVADFIAPRTLVISLKSGDLYVLTLLVDNMNAVKSIQLEKAAASVIPSVCAKCDDGFVFLGSSLGNSLLLRYWERSSYSVKIDTTEPKAKKMRPETDTQDDLEIYGEVVAVKTEELLKVIQYSFDVCDSILNIGPCAHMCAGETSVIADEYLIRKMDPVVDLVSVCGYAKNGALAVLQRSVRPHLVTTSTIANASKTVTEFRSLFTVGIAQVADPELGLIDGAQKYLLISKEVDTMVLEMRGEITELETSGFVMNARTVAAGDLGNGQFIIQVTPMSCILLENNEKVQEVNLDTTFPVSQASILDPYVVLLTDNGEVLLVEFGLDEYGDGYQLKIPATAVSLYKDMNNVFCMAGEAHGRCANDLKINGGAAVPVPRGYNRLSSESEPVDIKPYVSGPVLKKPQSFKPEAIAGKTQLSADDEDALLYGDEDSASTPTVKREIKFEANTSIEPQTPTLTMPAKFSFDSRPLRFDSYDPDLDEPISLRQPDTGYMPRQQQGIGAPLMPTFWVAICRENGLLEIFALPEFKLVYMVRKFPVGYRTLHDTDPLRIQLEGEKLDTEKLPHVRELLLVGLGANKGRPFLFAVVEHELFVYEAFPYFTEGIPDHLAVRFKRLQHRVILRNQKLTGRAAKLKMRPDQQQHQSALGLGAGQKIFHYFENVSGYSGVFVAGPYPFWILVSTQGILRFHPMHIDGTVLSLAPFHNINCYQGFIYLNSQQDMRICQLPSHISYDASIPVHKVSLKTSAHFVVYLIDSKTYAVALSTKKPNKTLVSLVGDDKQFETLDREDPNFIYPQLDTYSVQLFSPESWEPVPGAKLDMDEFENVTVMKEIQLLSEGRLSGMQNYLAVGTCYNYGEEVLVRGRIFICEIIEVVPEPDQPLTKHKIKVLYNKEQKGPVSSLCSLSGYLLTAMAQKVYIWQFKDGDLIGISFLDMQVYVHQMVSIRGIALVADVFKSISILRYQSDCKALSMASRDPRQLEVYAVEFMVDNTQLAFLCSDGLDNIFIYQYQPEARESNGGQRLIRRADIHTGCRVNSIVRVRCHVTDPAVDQKTLAYRRHICLFGTFEGALGYVLPVPEKVYRRLLMLQNLLIGYLPHVAGLNPKAFRCTKHSGVALQNAQRNVLDGDLLWLFINMSSLEKLDLAKRIGTSKEQLLDDLLEIERSTTHF